MRFPTPTAHAWRRSHGRHASRVAPAWTCTRQMIVACVRIVAGGKATRECRTFDTTTAGLQALLAWLTQAGLHPCGDGGDRGLLEAGLEHPERGRVRADRGQCRPHQERSRPQDRHERRHVDRRSGGLRPDQGELRAGGGDPGAALAAARPQATRARADPPRPAHPEDAGRGQHQAGFGDQRHHGRQRPADDRGDDRRRDAIRRSWRRWPTGGIKATPQGVVRRTARPADRASPLHAAAASGPIRCAGRRRSRDRSDGRRGDRAHGQGGDGRPGHLSLPDRCCCARFPASASCRATIILAEIGTRHEPLPDRRPSAGLGRAVSGPERERRQAQILAAAQGRALAQDHAGPMRLGGHGARRTATTRRSSTDCAPGAARRKPSAPSPPRC